MRRPLARPDISSHNSCCTSSPRLSPRASRSRAEAICAPSIGGASYVGHQPSVVGAQLGPACATPLAGYFLFTSRRKRPVHRGQGPLPAQGVPQPGHGRVCRIGASGPGAGSVRLGTGGAAATGRIRASPLTTSCHDSAPFRPSCSGAGRERASLRDAGAGALGAARATGRGGLPGRVARFHAKHEGQRQPAFR